MVATATSAAALIIAATAAATLIVSTTTAARIALVVVSTTTTTTGGAIVAASEKLNALSHDAETAALLTGVLVIPLVELETAFHQEWTTFAHVLADVFSRTAEDIDINKGNLFALFTGFGAPDTIDSKPDLGDRRAFGRVPQLGVAGQIAHEDDFVKTGHLYSFVAG